MVNTLSSLGAAGDSHEIVTLQRTLPGWVPNTTVYDSLKYAIERIQKQVVVQHVRNNNRAS